MTTADDDQKDRHEGRKPALTIPVGWLKEGDVIRFTVRGDVFAVCSCDRRKGERRMGGEVKNKGFYVLVYNKTPYGAEMKVAPERRTLIPGFDSWASVERRKRGSSPSMDKP